MKQSIRIRFTMIFISILMIMLIAIWAMNNWFLEGYYVSQKVKMLEDAYQLINTNILEKVENGEQITDEFDYSEQAVWKEGTLAWKLREMGDSSNIATVLVDSISGSVYGFAGNQTMLKDRVKDYIFGQGTARAELLRNHENYVIQRSYDHRSKSFYLESWGFFSDNTTMFIMSMPITSIRESAELSNRFLAYAGIVVMLVGTAVMYFATKRIISPIQSLSSLSERMSRLDFDAKYTGTEKDEIGVLGHSMNQMSEKLKETIEELKTANNTLQKDIEEKIQIDEMRKEFIANVSHELKTPIALIQGYAEGLTEGMAEDAESRDYYCEVIMDEANKMNRMVKQLLTLTALEFGNDTAVFQRFDLTELIQGLLTSAGILLEQKEAQVEFTASEPVYVWADEFKIEEVVTNYLNNALNHLDGQRKIRISVESQGAQVKVTVFNTGKHIPEEDLPNIWTKFYKVDKARTRAYGGSGIGLSIVKAIMDSHHQSCGAGNVDGGVEFWFTLDSSQE